MMCVRQGLQALCVALCGCVVCFFGLFWGGSIDRLWERGVLCCVVAGLPCVVLCCLLLTATAPSDSLPILSIAFAFDRWARAADFAFAANIITFDATATFSCVVICRVSCLRLREKELKLPSAFCMLLWSPFCTSP